MKIDLSKLPEGSKWIGIDSDGEVWVYAVDPAAEEDGYDFSYTPKAGGGCAYIGMSNRFGDVHD